MALRHYITPVNIKKLSWLCGYQAMACEDPAGDRLWPFLTAARIIKCVILMADCNPERFRTVFMKHLMFYLSPLCECNSIIFQF